MQTQAGHRPCHRRITHPRSGATWIEVTVLVFILLTLAALLLPAVRSSRPVARRVECQNNVKQLTIAVMHYTAQSNGQLPWLTTKNDEGIVSNWLVDLLPGLDNSAARREWDSLPAVERANFEFSLKAFQCPVDPTSFQQDGGLSYVANSGFGNFDVDPKTNAVFEKKPHGQSSVDWNGDGIISQQDLALTISTGVFWPKIDGDRFRSNLDFIAANDGLSSTIQFTESLHAGKWNSAETLDLAVVVGVDRVTFRQDSDGNPSLALVSADLGPYGIQSGTVPGHTPSPSSNHGGTSIYGLADGSVRQISDKIDPLVYLRLMTPNGQRYGEAALGPEAY